MVGISEDGIKYHINNLKKKGFLKRIDPDKGGYLEIKRVNLKQLTMDLPLFYKYKIFFYKKSSILNKGIFPICIKIITSIDKLGGFRDPKILSNCPK